MAEENEQPVRRIAVRPRQNPRMKIAEESGPPAPHADPVKQPENTAQTAPAPESKNPAPTKEEHPPAPPRPIAARPAPAAAEGAEWGAGTASVQLPSRFLRRQRRERHHSRRKLRIPWGDLRFLALAALFLAGLAAAGFASCYYLGRGAGLAEGRRKGAAAVEALNPSEPLPQELHRRLDAALAAPSAEETVKQLIELKKEAPGLASIDYLIATRAVQAGDLRLARRAAEESLNNYQRVAECKTLLSVLSPPDKAMRLLAEAAAADTAAPLPYLSVLMRLRQAGDSEGAAQALRAARLRLMPVEPAAVIGPIEALMRLQNLPDDQLPREPVHLDLGDARWPNAYLALRRGDTAAAAALLREIRADSPPGLFNFLRNDPAFRPYLERAEIREALHGP